jgi:hypothetical protein
MGSRNGEIPKQDVVVRINSNTLSKCGDSLLVALSSKRGVATCLGFIRCHVRKSREGFDSLRSRFAFANSPTPRSQIHPERPLKWIDVLYVCFVEISAANP